MSFFQCPRLSHSSALLARFQGALIVALLFVPTGSLAETFTASGAAIPDGDPAGVEIEFEVTGLTAPIGRVQVSLTLDHPHQGDLVATLVSPRGEARLALFGRVGYRPPAFGGVRGVDANFDGTYTFDDYATRDLWQETRQLNDTQDIVPSGVYRTSTPAPIEGAVLSNAGGCASYLSAVFAGLEGDQANGSWKIEIVDRVATESGSVASAELILDPLPETPIYAESFESPGAFTRSAPQHPILVRSSGRLGSCTPAPFDFTGTGRTSYSVVRDNVEPNETGDTLLWIVRSNGGEVAPDQQFLFGDAAGDTIMPDDYDGDGRVDAAVWSAQRGFRIRRTSRPGDVVVVDFGQSNDDLNQSGDYDGDGVADVALVRYPLSSGMGRALVSGSAQPLTRSLALANGSLFNTFAAGGFDMTGDGLADIPVQTVDPAAPESGLFTVFGGDGSGAQDSFVFGSPNDVIVPGNHTGNSLGDIALGSSDSGDRVWTVRDTATGSLGGAENFGRTTDFLLGGDFDGDGMLDRAVFRPDSNPGDSRFLIRPSGGGSDFEVRFGENQDAPVPNARVH